MTHSPALKDLLFNVRQHPAFKELLAAVEQPKLPQYRPSKGESLEALGARTVFVSGQADQHDRWIGLLMGNPARETETSQQE